MAFDIDEKMISHDRAIITRNLQEKDLNNSDPVKFKPGMIHYISNKRKLYLSVEPYIGLNNKQLSVVEIITNLNLSKTIDELKIGRANLSNYYDKFEIRELIQEQVRPLRNKLYENNLTKSNIDKAEKVIDEINKVKGMLHTHNNSVALGLITREKIESWDNKSNFSGDYNDLLNKPMSLKADGGNADTLCGKELSFFAPKNELDKLRAVVEKEALMSDFIAVSGYEPKSDNTKLWVDTKNRIIKAKVEDEWIEINATKEV